MDINSESNLNFSCKDSDLNNVSQGINCSFLDNFTPHTLLNFKTCLESQPKLNNDTDNKTECSETDTIQQLNMLSALENEIGKQNHIRTFRLSTREKRDKKRQLAKEKQRMKRPLERLRKKEQERQINEQIIQELSPG